LALEIGPEFIGRHRDGFSAELLELVDHGGVLQDRGQRVVQLVDHGRRRACRCEQAGEGLAVKILVAELGKRRDIGQRLQGCGLVTASARNWPALMCCRLTVSWSNANCTWPPKRSLTA